jgi:NTP pyrophosphatase (non-canonical NTP hydrolase)
MNDLKQLLDRLIKFRDERNWKQFHTPENLAKSISIEANELLENYQWGKENADIENIKEEVADVLGYILLLCEELNIDLIKESNNKIDKNIEKYPIDKAYGLSKKYTKL